MEEYSDLRCKDCIFSKVSFIDKVFSLGKPSAFHYKCTKYIIPAEHDPVLGQTTKESIGYCTTARYNQKHCGPKATLWMPKTKYGLFDLLKK